MSMMEQTAEANLGIFTNAGVGRGMENLKE